MSIWQMTPLLVVMEVYLIFVAYMILQYSHGLHFQYGFFEGVFLNNDKFPKLNAAIDKIAANYEVSNTTIALAWILRHPAHMQPVTGTMNAERLKDCMKAADIYLTREEWYEIYCAAGNVLP